jgi:hypothetical protein
VLLTLSSDDRGHHIPETEPILASQCQGCSSQRYVGFPACWLSVACSSITRAPVDNHHQSIPAYQTVEIVRQDGFLGQSSRERGTFRCGSSATTCVRRRSPISPPVHSSEVPELDSDSHLHDVRSHFLVPNPISLSQLFSASRVLMPCIGWTPHSARRDVTSISTMFIVTQRRFPPQAQHHLHT